MVTDLGLDDLEGYSKQVATADGLLTYTESLTLWILGILRGNDGVSDVACQGGIPTEWPGMSPNETVTMAMRVVRDGILMWKEYSDRFHELLRARSNIVVTSFRPTEAD